MTAAKSYAPAGVFVVDDHPLFRQGVISWLKEQPNLAFRGEADSVATARTAVPLASPDVLLLDVHLRDGDGLLLATELAAQLLRMRILMLSQFEEDTFAHRALRAGARGYLMKSEAPETVMTAIETVLRGDLYLSRTLPARLLQNLFPDPASDSAGLARLSNRELQVFQMLGAGCRPSAIAAKLCISPKTVDTHRDHLRQKLSLSNADALQLAARSWAETGKLDPGQLPGAVGQPRPA